MARLYNRKYEVIADLEGSISYVLEYLAGKAEKLELPILSGSFIESAELIGLDVDRGMFSNITFRNVKFDTSTDIDSVFSGCSFNNCTFYGARYTSTSFIGCKFYLCDLYDVEFDQTLFNNCVWETSNIDSCTFRSVTGKYNIFDTTKVENTNFYNSDISDTLEINRKLPEKLKWT